MEPSAGLSAPDARGRHGASARAARGALPGHCAFDGEVRDQAFNDLVAWIEWGIKPDGDDVLAADVSTLGLRWTRILHTDDPARQTAGRVSR